MHQTIFTEAVQLAENARPFVLATVVKTSGSSPQKAGAKMLVREDGSILGTLGGGCVEGDIWYIAGEMLRRHEPPRFQQYDLNETMAARDGLVCGGTMYFFIEPVFSGQSFLPYAGPVLKACAGEQPLALAIVVKSSEAKVAPGRKLLIYEDGSCFGDIREPHLREILVPEGRKLAAFGEARYLALESGEEVYLEGFTTPPTLIILGGGHVGKAVSSLAAMLGFRIFVVDDRKEFANPERFPEAAGTVVAEYAAGLQQLEINANSDILIATRGHRYDDIALRAAIDTPARYIGLLGSKRKSLLIFRGLLESGATLEQLRRVRAPVGLAIGALSPEELAVSIMAEIIACRRGGVGGTMRIDDAEIEKLIERG